MRTATVATRLSGEGALVAGCSACGLALRQVEGFDRDIALGTLFQHHPASPAAFHRAAVPAGWRQDELEAGAFVAGQQQEDR